MKKCSMSIYYDLRSVCGEVCVEKCVYICLDRGIRITEAIAAVREIGMAGGVRLMAVTTVREDEPRLRTICRTTEGLPTDPPVCKPATIANAYATHPLYSSTHPKQYSPYNSTHPITVPGPITVPTQIQCPPKYSTFLIIVLTQLHHSHNYCTLPITVPTQ